MHDTALETIAAHAAAGARLREEFFRLRAEDLRLAALRTAACLAQGGKVLFCGNGGSAADAQHLAAELVNRFLMDRPALPGLALTTDTSALTAIGNDLDFSRVFARQVEALGRKGDVLAGISTSGNSPNVLAALETARRAGLCTIGFTGNGGGAMASLCDILLDVPHTSTPLIQETHIAAGHLLCQLTDYYLFENVAALQPLLATAARTEV
ncbi:D-sedoheptulose 7-phosphate isomerase [Desulfovibrio legallii]|uniref:Phosphoheptose isomerase n=1 Tax=Desulfovibrio legallii TaxID=571438 RepID=A0A1G7LI05_9BACT|nr:D-sedoheptulose 7-phosphate isomerase [Desulfovibrio legallii]SDF49073.1 phosphoheptose isomerase [Desulfovibrio legallii]